MTSSAIAASVVRRSFIRSSSATKTLASCASSSSYSNFGSSTRCTDQRRQCLPLDQWRRWLSSSSHASAAIRRKAIEKHGAPPSIHAIPGDDEMVGLDKVGAIIRQVGCTRRVFVLDPHLTKSEMEGLAYRIRALTKNDAINSVLIATDDTDDIEMGALPASLLMRNDPYYHDESSDEAYTYPIRPGHTWHVSGGYDPLSLFDTKTNSVYRAEQVETTLRALQDLFRAVRGSKRETKIPTISIPHGLVTDGGYAMCLSSTYVLATRETSFQIRNPRIGLSLEPVGLSYILPRLGQEFQQPCAKHCPGTPGMILALTGYQADASDMMETGLATHYIETPTVLGTLEATLAEIPPWNQQGLLKDPVRLYGQPAHTQSYQSSYQHQHHWNHQKPHDHNGQFRNVAVADAIHCISEYRADGTDLWDCSGTYNRSIEYDDPSLETDYVPWHETRTSDLVDYAATFHPIFQEEKTLVGIRERLREIASKQLNDDADPDEVECVQVASEFVNRIERQSSPLALRVVFRLMQLGAEPNETFSSCMERELRAQINMYTKSSDFRAWASHNNGNGSNATPFIGWKHSKLEDVTDDQVEEIIMSEKQSEKKNKKRQS